MDGRDVGGEMMAEITAEFSRRTVTELTNRK